MHPQNISAYLDYGVTMVTLECAADGFPHPVISWVENSSTVINESVIQNGTLSSLVLTFRVVKKALRYRCMARNSVGVVFSKEATLAISERPTKSAMEGRLNPSKYYSFQVRKLSRRLQQLLQISNDTPGTGADYCIFLQRVLRMRCVLSKMVDYSTFWSIL